MRIRSISPTRHAMSTVVVLGLLALAAVAFVGWLFFAGGDRDTNAPRTDMFEVRQGSFDITIPASGELVAQNQIEIRNRLETRAIITDIVDEGTFVRAGDVVLKLNDEEIRNRIKDAEDSVNSAESTLISAEATLAIRRSSAESELDRAHLDVELAQLALDAWREGEVVAKRQQLELALERTRVNYERLVERVEYSTELYKQEFISKDELKRDEIELIEAAAAFQQAETDLKVFNDYTFLQEQKQKNSDLEQAKAELDRVKQRHEAEIQTALADVASRKHQLESSRERLTDLRKQLDYCTVEAPADGLVVYASSLESHRWRGDPPQVGSELSRNQLVMVLPDTSRLLAAVKVNEALSGLIQPGQPAIITSDAMPDQSVRGTVQSIGVLAETGGWRDPNRRDYTVRILLDDSAIDGLRPSMRARAEILVDRAENATYVPIQAVFREGGVAYVYVPQRGGFAQQPVSIGRSSELYAEILESVSPGDRVLLRRPESSEVVRTLPKRPGMSNGQSEQEQELLPDVLSDSDEESPTASPAAATETASREAAVQASTDESKRRGRRGSRPESETNSEAGQ